MKKIQIPQKRIFLLCLVIGILISYGFSPIYDYISSILKENFNFKNYNDIITTLVLGIILGCILFFLIDLFLNFFAHKLLKYLISELRKKEILPAKFSLKSKIKTGKIYENIEFIFESFLNLFFSIKQDKDKFSKTLEKYLDPSLKVEIETRKEHEIYVGGKRKKATVLFSDIRGFTTLTELHDPKDVIEILNDYFDMATRIIDKNRGRVNKYIGDAILAIFEEAPKYADYIDCDKAIIAALDIQENFKILCKKWQDKINPTLSLGLGIGIAKGEVILGNIGSEQRMEYTVIGDIVNIASRLCDIAKPGQIIITEEIYNIMENLIIVDVLPAVQLKGKSGLYNIYSVKTRKMIV